MRTPLAWLLNRFRRRIRLEARINHAYPEWLARRAMPQLCVPADAPGFSIIMPVYRTRPEWLSEAIASVRAQTHGLWELLITDDASACPEIDAVLAQAAAEEPRIRVQRLASRCGISAASNAALSRAVQPFVAFVDHDDRLAPHALAAMACELAAYPQIDLAFSDEDQLIDGARTAPYFKPGWNPDLMASQNLVCHLAVYRRALVERLGGLRGAFDGSQDYDLALRAMAAGARIRHVPDVLYHWRQSTGSFSSVAAPRCRDAARRALAEALGPAASVEADRSMPQWPRVRFEHPPARVAVVHGLWDALPADADVVVFLSAYLRAVEPDWLDSLVSYVMRPGIGAAGGRLDWPAGARLHAGYVLDPGSIVQTPAVRADDCDPGYRGHYHLARTVSAVSADCLAVRRDVFLAAGGFTPDAGDFAAVDFCLKLAAVNLRIVWVPQARLRYTVAPTMPAAGAQWMRARWADALEADPYANANVAAVLHAARRLGVSAQVFLAPHQS